MTKILGRRATDAEAALARVETSLGELVARMTEKLVEAKNQVALGRREEMRLAKQAEVQTRLNRTSAEGQNSINVRAAEFQAQITALQAERDLYERSKHAEADLLVKSAEADGTELINRAMEGAGSDKLLRLRKGLAILNSIKGPIYITEDPTDIGHLSSKH